MFGSEALILPNVNPVGYMWDFVRKRNDENEIVRWHAFWRKVSLISPGIDYDETYSLVMDVVTFHYLVSLVVSEKLNMQLMDMIASYLYGDLNTEI